MVVPSHDAAEDRVDGRRRLVVRSGKQQRACRELVRLADGGRVAQDQQKPCHKRGYGRRVGADFGIVGCHAYPLFAVCHDPFERGRHPEELTWRHASVVHRKSEIVARGVQLRGDATPIVLKEDPQGNQPVLIARPSRHCDAVNAGFGQDCRCRIKRVIVFTRSRDAMERESYGDARHPKPLVVGLGYPDGDL
jgi:hypothetical protein